MASTRKLEQTSASNTHKKPKWQTRYQDIEPDFNMQFCHLYFVRLAQLRKRLTQIASKSWSSEANLIERILDVPTNGNYFFVGIIYWAQPKKPYIIDEVKEELWVTFPKYTGSYESENGDEEEVAYIEDESGRIKMIGDCLDKSKIPTGSAIAVLGSEEASGAFNVKEYKTVGILDQEEIKNENKDDMKRFIAFVSGISANENSNLSQLELLKEFLLGVLDDDQSKDIVKLIVAGDSFQSNNREDETDDNGNVTNGSKENRFSPEQALDNFLNDVSQSLPIDLMPGPNDPINCSLPQKPLGRWMFEKSKSQSTLNLTTNPYDNIVDDLRIIGTSGQPIFDLHKVVSKASSLDLLETTLDIGHLAPTAPDTIYVHSYKDVDPFIIDSAPHIYFAGNQEKFETKLLFYNSNQNSNMKVRLICLPKFKDTNQIILVNTNTLECQCIKLEGEIY